MIPWLDDATLDFPPTSLALGPESDVPGLLAAGGSMSPERLHAAYRRGIFPWYAPGQPPLWWSPDPRMVLKTADFKLSHSLRKTLKRFVADPRCEIRVDTATSAVLTACANTPREGQSGTWIVPELQTAYLDWAARGAVHSIETWMDGQLVGGLYGIFMNGIFVGESMFHLEPNVTKLAMLALIERLASKGHQFMDTQMAIGLARKWGAKLIPRLEYERRLAVARQLDRTY